MASMAETLGMTLPGNAAIPAADSRRMALAEMSGRRIMEMVREDLKPSKILTREAFDNAVRTGMAIGGSTNAIIHLIAMAGRAGVDLPLTRFDELSRTTPMLLNVRPSGKYLMEDFFYAGGLPVVLKELLPLLHGDALTVTGKTIAENNAEAVNYNADVIRSLAMPILNEGGTAILTGNLCPNGAVLKQSAASPHLLTHRGRAVVFEDHADLHARIDDPALDVDETCVLVLKRVGPKGAPGMPEWGAAPIPKKLLQRGVKDMVRISDARMSGTSYGTVVLHVSPEAEAGGPLALVQNGDQIELDIPNRRLTLRVPDEELARRRAQWKPRPPHFTRGYGRLFLDHVLQAHEGCDFDSSAARPLSALKTPRAPATARILDSDRENRAEALKAKHRFDARDRQRVRCRRFRVDHNSAEGKDAAAKDREGRGPSPNRHPSPLYRRLGHRVGRDWPRARSPAGRPRCALGSAATGGGRRTSHAVTSRRRPVPHTHS